MQQPVAEGAKSASTVLFQLVRGGGRLRAESELIGGDLSCRSRKLAREAAGRDLSDERAHPLPLRDRRARDAAEPGCQ